MYSFCQKEKLTLGTFFICFIYKKKKKCTIKFLRNTKKKNKSLLLALSPSFMSLLLVELLTFVRSSIMTFGYPSLGNWEKIASATFRCVFMSSKNFLTTSFAVDFITFLCLPSISVLRKDYNRFLLEITYCLIVPVSLSI